jgi:pantoate--beta-alanine ligase
VIRVARTLTELRTARRELLLRRYHENNARPLVGLTPTMGALHTGHSALIERMSAECAVGIVSLFVNPRQFGPHEDFGKYPRMFEADVALCEAAGAQVVFAPGVDEMYPGGYATTISVAGLTQTLCGASRPGHFDGVTTVVAKLFTLCGPDQAYFGEKDYQQLVVVQRMAADLNLDVEIVPCPIVRESDGLAMSSRNAYLSPAERSAAPRLHQALQHMRQRFAAGVTAASRLINEGSAILAGADGPQFALEYLAVVDPQTLEPRSTAQPGDRVLIAARLGATRLIDNATL